MYSKGICNSGHKVKIYLGGTPMRAASAVHPTTALPLFNRAEKPLNPRTGMPFKETRDLVRAS